MSSIFFFSFFQYFFSFINRGKHLKNETQFNEYKAKLIEENFYAGDHPFFCEDSPFYLSTDDELIKPVINNAIRFDPSIENFVSHSI